MSLQTTIKIAIADDHKIFRDGMSMALKKKPDLKLIWEANNGIEMMKKTGEQKPDVILMDIRMPELDGINAISLIRKEFTDIKIIMLTMYDDEEMISKLMEMGANAYLTKTTDPEEVYKAILACMSNDHYYTETVNRVVTRNILEKKNTIHLYKENMPVSFNENEIKILNLLAEDMGTEQMSKTIFLSPRTIETIRQNMKNKVNAKTIGGLIMYGLRNNLIK